MSQSVRLARLLIAIQIFFQQGYPSAPGFLTLPSGASPIKIIKVYSLTSTKSLGRVPALVYLSISSAGKNVLQEGLYLFFILITYRNITKVTRRLLCTVSYRSACRAKF